MENVTIINTNYAKFELCKKENKIYERHNGYSKGCFFTEWEETLYNSIEDAEKGIYYLYCSDY